MNTRRIVLVLVLTILAACAFAQERTTGPFGKVHPVRSKAVAPALPAGGDLFAVTLGAWDFGPGDSTVTYQYAIIGSGDFLMKASGPGGITEVLASVHLPSGVFIDSIELDYCDLDASQDVGVSLNDCLDDAGGPGACVPIAFAQSTGSGGCGYANSGAVGVTVDNVNHDYIVEVNLPYPANAGFRGVKVYYFLQVSPAPATATFNDVSTSDPAFQFVEAFARAGITAGCQANPPLYCPDNFVTRRQMAVFFAKALGLRWPG